MFAQLVNQFGLPNIDIFYSPYYSKLQHN